MGEVWKSSPQGPAELCGPGCTAQPAQGSLWGSLLPAGLFFSFTLKPNLATQPKRWCHMATSSEAVNPQCYYQDRDILNQLLRCRSVYIYGNPSEILNGKKRSFSFKNAPPTSFFFLQFHPIVTFYFFHYFHLPKKANMSHFQQNAPSVPVCPVLMAFSDGRCCARQEPNEKKKNHQKSN